MILADASQSNSGRFVIFKKVRRLVIWAIAIALVGVTVFMAVRPRPVLVDMATVVQGPMDVRVEDDGQTRIRERYVVSTPLTGRLLRITFDVGDEVKAHNTVLAQMEPTDPTLLDPRSMAQAKARVNAAEHRLQAAKSSAKRAAATLNFAEKEMGRVRRMHDKNVSSKSEFEEKILLFEQVTEEARSAELAVEIAEYELELEKAALLLTDPETRDEDNMELSIRSPIDGRILRIIQESTAVVTAGSPLMELGDPLDLEIVADVLSRDAVKISPGDKVILKHWGGDLDLNGHVRLVEPSGFTKISALGVEEQRVNVIIDLDDPPEQRTTLGDGFRVDCEVVVWESDSTLRVPTSALFRMDGQWHAFRVDGQRAKLTPVEIGKNNGETAELIEGLKADDRVITHPTDSVVDGVLVQAR